MDGTKYLQRPGGSLAYEVSGQGPLVVASPGMGDLRATYRFLVPALVAAGFRVATVDLRGHGQSSTGWPAYDESAVAGDLLALTEQLGGPAVLIGNSYSGGAAVVAAARRPDLVRALVLSGAFVRTVPQKLLTRLAGAVVSSTPLGRSLWGAYIPSFYPGHKPDDFAEHRGAVKANLAEPGRWPAVAAMAGNDHDAAEAALPKVTAPALVVIGTADPDFPDPAAEAQLTAERLGGPARVLLVDGAGHYPHTQNPEVVTPAVLAFLTDLPAVGSSSGPDPAAERAGTGGCAAGDR